MTKGKNDKLMKRQGVYSWDIQWSDEMSIKLLNENIEKENRMVKIVSMNLKMDIF